MQTSTLTGPAAAPPAARLPACQGALVMGADYRGLGIVRSLGRRGIPVWVLKQDGQLLSAASRYARRSVACPRAHGEGQQVAFLQDLATRKGLAGWALFPTSDDAVALVGRHHQALAEHYRLTTPPWDTLKWGCDKRLLHSIATDLGIDSPWTFCPRHRDELAALDCPFPVILKPAMRLGFNPINRDKAWRVENRASLLARYDEACRFAHPELLMVQEVVPGGGASQLSFAALARHGCALASIVARRTRQFPMDFGRFSTYVESVEEPEVERLAVHLLAGMDYTGLVEVEFKRDARNGKLKILDVNPRVWGWHTLSWRAGVDFPYLAWRLVNGQPVPLARAHAGERWMRMGADVPMAMQEILHGRLSLGEYLKSLRSSVECATFAWDDPLPGLLGPTLFVTMAATRLLKLHTI